MGLRVVISVSHRVERLYHCQGMKGQRVRRCIAFKPLRPHHQESIGGGNQRLALKYTPVNSGAYN